MTALLASGEVLAAWIVAAATLCGLGALARRVAGRTAGRTAFDDLFWLGWAACLALLQLWNLVWPVDGRAALGIAAAGVIGLATRPDARRAIGEVVRSLATWRGVGLAVIALWVANLALDAPHHGDSGLYHFAAVRWAAEYPIVPGLGNLHGRLAFNSSYMLWVALLGSGPFAGRGFHLANGVLLLVPLCRSLIAAAALARGRAAARPSRLFDALMLFPLLERVWNLHYLTSPTPDMPIFILGIVTASALTRVVETRALAAPTAEPDPGASSVAPDAAAVVVAAAIAGVVTKLSFAVFAAVAAVIVVGVEVARRPGERDATGVRAAFAAGVLMLLPWLVRGTILSGYPLYPYPGVSLPVAWAVPAAQARIEYDWVRSWAREPNRDPAAVLADWGWFGPWLRGLATSAHALLTVVGPLLVAILAAGVIAIRLAARARAARASVPLLLVPLSAAVGLVYWFVEAPAVRFAGSAFWVLGGGLAVAALFGLDRRRLTRTVAWASIAFAGAGLLHEVWQRGPLVVASGPDGGFRPPPSPRLVVSRTQSGLEVFTPAVGEACWDAPLPCAPYVEQDLRLRVAGRLGAGFERGAGAPARGTAHRD